MPGWILIKQGCPGYLFEEPDDILTDLRQPDDDIVHEDVIQGGVVSALPTGLRQNQVPAVHRRKEVLIFPRACGNKNQKGQVNTSKRYIFKRMLSAHSHPPLHAATGISSSSCTSVATQGCPVAHKHPYHTRSPASPFSNWVLCKMAQEKKHPWEGREFCSFSPLTL